MSEAIIVKDLGPVEIQQYQQNRYPCFFIDYLEEAIAGRSARGYKNFTYNEWFFPVHFADEPSVPGFIQIEMLTQVFLMTFLTYPENKGKKTGFVAVNKARFKKKIEPGHRIDIVATLDSYKRGLAQGRSVGYLGGEVACQVDLTIAVPDVMNAFIPGRTGQ